MITFYWYPKCGTCRKAKKWLDDKGISYEAVHIAEAPPTKEELKAIYENSGLPLTKFFNTSGMKYRELGLKDKLKDMSEDEMLSLLSSDGMLIKRPIAYDGEKVTVGFKEENYKSVWA
ncbi:arsenate reductase family protein [Pradoshia sp.]